ncbi:hypothetical protein B0H13DRAFT_1861746 [Mycena leptocephala]|nr:hypothetical protein B0H13DRAFT_1861746 [Mycena leptocephala]
MTFRNYDHMEKSLEVARTYGVQFQTGEVEGEFEGTTYKLEFQRNPLVPRAKFYRQGSQAVFLTSHTRDASGNGGGVLIGYMVIVRASFSIFRKVQKLICFVSAEDFQFGDDHGKDFAFYKQHACAHVNDDTRDKGVPAGYSTRPEEGFHQEVKEAYSQKWSEQ